MARRPRIALAGEPHLLALRGHSAGAVFTDEEDRRAFADMAALASREQRVAVHAWALADHEVRLLATPATGEGLARWMQSLGRRYGAAFNLRHGRRGTLWDGRFRSCVLEADGWLLDGIVHVETLPVRAGLVAQAGDWPWSSAAHHLGRQREPWVSEHVHYWDLGNTPFERELAHARLLDAGVSGAKAGRLEAALARGQALGEAAFLSGVAAQTGQPTAPRPRGRPKNVPI
jgi:putative transposase